MQDAVEVIAAEREGKRQLARQLAALEARVSNDSGRRSAEVDRLLSQVGLFALQSAVGQHVCSGWAIEQLACDFACAHS